MKVLELYCGIGGMHLALKDSGLSGEIVLSVDINPTCSEIYKKNFPNNLFISRNIQSLTPDFLNKLNADTLLMSPPCQPFTRNGLQNDCLDQRSVSFLHILNILPDLSIKKLLIENVKGFEESKMRILLIQSLERSGFKFQEFLLNPVDYGIPNSRLRYYCLAKKSPEEFCFETGPLMELLPLIEKHEKCFAVAEILDQDVNEEFLVPDKILFKYWKVLDICYPESRRTCCFTKAYGRYAEGTGSVITEKCEEEAIKLLDRINSSDDNECMQLLRSLKLRYFTPSEISRLMGFPDIFTFPNTISKKQKYMVLGNSINVKIVSMLIKLLQ